MYDVEKRLVTGRYDVTGTAVATGRYAVVAVVNAVARYEARLAAQRSRSFPGYQPLIKPGSIGVTTCVATG
jgi:hypothetical protein